MRLLFHREGSYHRVNEHFANGEGGVPSNPWNRLWKVERGVYSPSVRIFGVVLIPFYPGTSHIFSSLIGIVAFDCFSTMPDEISKQFRSHCGGVAITYIVLTLREYHKNSTLPLRQDIPFRRRQEGSCRGERRNIQAS